MTEGLCPDFYEKLTTYLTTEDNIFHVNFINVQDKLMNCLIYKNVNDVIHACIYHNERKMATLLFSLKANDSIDLEKILTLIKNQHFCLEQFCTTIISSTNQMINNKCFNCYYESCDTSTMEEECSICLEKNTVKSINLKCNHIFHKSCLFKSSIDKCDDHIHISCPLCRTNYQYTYNFQEITRNECPDN